MGELCAGIAAQFPDTYEKIAKYQEALLAYNALQAANTLIEQVDLDREHKDVPLMVKVGKQTRHNRTMSQRVRLGNAVVRLTGAAQALYPFETDGDAEALLQESIETVDGISFPKTYG